jgi:putative heme-binding domain-containing protein
LAGLVLLLAAGHLVEAFGDQPLELSLLGENPDSLAKAARDQGDPARGAAIFYQPSLNCTRCHADGDTDGDLLGPNLANLGKEATDAYLIDSILRPSKVIKKGFETVTIVTAGGQKVTGLLAAERAGQVTLRDSSLDGKRVTISQRDIDVRIDNGPSLMPAGLVNGLASRPQFLDLIRYLREIADGGPARARALRPDPSQVAGMRLPDYESMIDHAAMIAGLGEANLQRGEGIYNRVCVNCHGTKAAPGSLPTSLRFASGQFKNGKDPHSLYRTLTLGFGQMPPQTWMVPSQKYDVIHYLRETFLKTDNPTQYVAVDRAYLDHLPKGTTRGPEPSSIEPYSAMDYGPALTATYEVSDDGSNFAYKGIAVRLDAGPGGVSRGRHWAVFDHDTLRMAAAWTGDGFIDWNGINFNGRHETHPKIVGLVELANPDGPGWANPESGTFDDPRLRGRDGRPYGPLPRPWAHYRGQYRHGSQVVFAYAVGDTDILERQSVETVTTAPVFCRTLHVGPRTKELVLQVARRPGTKSRLRILPPQGDATRAVALLEPEHSSQPSVAKRRQSPLNGLARFREGEPPGEPVSAAARTEPRPPRITEPRLAENAHLEIATPSNVELSGGDDTIMARLQIIPSASRAPAIPRMTWSNTAEGDLRLAIPAGAGPLRFSVKLVRLPDPVDEKALARTIKDGPVTDLAELVRVAPGRWPEVLKSQITPGREDGPFAVDTIGIPQNNPWLCQLRLTGFDFLDSGHRAAVCTWDGDVWLASGIDAPSGEVSWKRIASGLFQPLGLKLRDGNIFVGCRDQIVILRDGNGDGETDFYENFNNDHQVTEHFHEFAMGLQTDVHGNFYYAKAARHGKTALVPQHGTLLRVSSDGLRTDILATGFRAPNGVCVDNDGTLFLTDQEGFWTPKNRINHVKFGGFYGNMWGYHNVTDTSDSAMEPPVCWITNEFDRSPAELVRVTSAAWGPLDGSLLNLSYGTGKLFVVPYENVRGVMQGGMCALPIPSLPTGVMRGRFHPKDGALYACGMFAWAGNQTAPGGFFRIRATGKPMFLTTGLHATKKGMEITFTSAIDRSSATDPSHYSVKTWSLERTEKYGSDHRNPKRLRASAASLSDDGRTISLTLPDIQPTRGMEINYRLQGSRGQRFEGTIHNTIHHLAATP